MARTLTARQLRFVQEYMVEPNATKAAIRAGYSPKRAAVEGAELRRHPGVAARLEADLQARNEEMGVDSRKILEWLLELRNADLADIFDADGSVRPVSEMPEVWRRGLITRLQVVEKFDNDGRVISRTNKVSICDRMRVLELIGRHVKQQTVTDHKHDDPLEKLAREISGNSIRPAS